MKWKQMTSCQKRKLTFWFLLYILTAIFFLGHAIRTMLVEKNFADIEYTAALTSLPTENTSGNTMTADAVPVTTGTYIETIKNISLKNSSFQTEFVLWFRWESERDISFLENNLKIQNGIIHHMEVLEDYHDGPLHYQSMRIDASISQNFDAACFPLGTQVLSFYISPLNYTSDTVVLIPDNENSDINSNLSASGYSLIRSNISSSLLRHLNTMGNPLLNEPKELSHIVVALELSRNSWGLFFQCFIALFGAVGWLLITLYICASHRVNPILTLPPAFSVLSAIWLWIPISCPI